MPHDDDPMPHDDDPMPHDDDTKTHDDDTKTPDEPRPQPPHRPLALVVDDDEGERENLTRILRELGYAVEAESNGRDAFNRAVALGPELIVTDIMMPGMDGLTALRMFSRKAETKDIPIIVVSGLNDKGAVDICRVAGADNYLVKPVAKDQLERAIGQLGKQ